jgi:hypothetical protein
MRLREICEQYAKHSALNFGQVLHGLRHFHSHPDVDRVAPRGSLRHLRLSVALRARRAGNDLFFAVVPPHWHHTADELSGMCAVPMARWFAYGYCTWRFDESGAPRVLDGTEDSRWDPRCIG